MAFNNHFSTSEQEPVADINMTPLIDVMLVLLVIFIITAPLLNQAIPLNLPKASGSAISTESKKVVLAVDANNTIYWDKKVIQTADISKKFKELAMVPTNERPEIHVRADQTAHYQYIAEIMSAAHTNGIEKIGFVTQEKNETSAKTFNTDN